MITGPAHHFVNRYRSTLNKDMLEEIELIEKNGNHLIKLVNEILDISKLESGELDKKTVTLTLDWYQSLVKWHKIIKDVEMYGGIVDI